MKHFILILILILLLMETKLNAQSSPFDAARVGDTTAIRAFLRSGGDPNLTDDRGASLLILAAYYSQEATVKILDHYGADLNAGDRSGNTALMGACFHNDLPIAQLLLELGADVNVLNLNFANALHFAANFGSRTLIELLLNAGVNTLQPDFMGKTPLDYLELQERNDVRDLLMKKAG